VNFKERNITADFTLLEALKKMDVLDKKLLLVTNGDFFQGLLSAGDIQRAIIKNIRLDDKVASILRSTYRIGKPGDTFEDIKQMMLEYRMEFCPVVDEQRKITDIHFWEDVFQNKKAPKLNQFQLPVIVMAGGVGSRLRPLTHVLPKPLVPIGSKTMMEEIFDRFSSHGCTEFFISVNYKADLIEFYLKSLHLKHSISYFKEEKPMGTAGSLSLLRGVIKQTFFINNCDILIDQDYSEILAYHRENKNEITLVAALKNYAIPYGILETGDEGQLLDIKEKPELTFKINSGMYILEPHLLDEIPDNSIFHITDLIALVKKRQGRVGVYPVSERAWKDVGDWKEYLQVINERNKDL
jgi:dTDP-glucose pyrophosphorylase